MMKYPQDGRKIFIKYPNRKLYCKTTSQYTTPTAIAGLPLGSFVVYKSGTSQDITDEILLSAINSHFRKNIESFESVKHQLTTMVRLAGRSK